MIGLIKVDITIWKFEDDDYAIYDDIKVETTCDYVHESMSGYGGSSHETYYEGYENFEFDKEEIEAYIKETYGNVAYEYSIDEDSFVEYDYE